jgi:hypothetical protein
MAKFLRSFSDADIRSSPDCETPRFILESNRQPITWGIENVCFLSVAVLQAQDVSIPQELAAETRPLAYFSPLFIGVRRAAQALSRATG